MFKRLYRLFQPAKAEAPAAEAGLQQTVTVRAPKPQDRQIEDDYVARLNSLMKDAEESRSTHTLVDVLTWTLARIAVRSGNFSAAGDVVYRFGGHLVSVNEWAQARAEAERERDEGAVIH
jgi:hypothetical protein